MITCQKSAWYLLIFSGGPPARYHYAGYGQPEPSMASVATVLHVPFYMQLKSRPLHHQKV